MTYGLVRCKLSNEGIGHADTSNNLCLCKAQCCLEDSMSVPTQGETYSQLMEHLRKAQEAAAMMMHLTRAQGGRKDNAIADGWFAISELFKRLQHQVTQLATKRLN